MDTEEQVVVATANTAFGDRIGRWCAASGVTAQQCADLDSLRRQWRSARLILLGEDLVPLVADASLPRSDHLHLVVAEPDTWWRTAVDVGASGVLRLDDEAAGVATVGAALDAHREGCGIAVVGGRGGVGATTLAVALGLTAARRRLSAVVVDADPWGPGVDLVAGTERVEGLRWSTLAATAGRVSPGSLAGALPVHRDLATIGWDVHDDAPVLPDSAGSVWAAATRAFDLVVVDQAVGGDDAWSRQVLGGSALTVLVVADDVTGVASARRRAAWLRPRSAMLAAVVAQRPGGLGAHGVAEVVGVPVVARIRPDRTVRTAIDQGRGPGGSRVLARASSDVLDLVGLDRGTTA